MYCTLSVLPAALRACIVNRDEDRVELSGLGLESVLYCTPAHGPSAGEYCTEYSTVMPVTITIG